MTLPRDADHILGEIRSRSGLGPVQQRRPEGKGDRPVTLRCGRTRPSRSYSSVAFASSALRAGAALVPRTTPTLRCASAQPLGVAGRVRFVCAAGRCRPRASDDPYPPLRLSSAARCRWSRSLRLRCGQMPPSCLGRPLPSAAPQLSRSVSLVAFASSALRADAALVPRTTPTLRCASAQPLGVAGRVRFVCAAGRCRPRASDDPYPPLRLSSAARSPSPCPGRRPRTSSPGRTACRGTGGC
ncbi:hypothetical protein ACVWXU_005927 [Streptomyces sp. TE33382]